MVSVLLAGCGSEAASEKPEETAKTTTGASVNLGDEVTTTTAKKVEGAVVIGDKTEPAQTTEAPKSSEPSETEAAATTTTAVKEEQPSGSFSASDAVIEFNSVKIKPDDDFSRIKASLGKPDEEYSSPSCLYDGDDKTFIYGGVTIYTYPSGDKDKVLETEVASGSAKTPKGLKIGLSVDEVTKLYGDAGYDGYTIEYKDGKTVLYVQFENDRVKAFGVLTE